MSVSPIVSTQLPQDTFASNYVLEIFMKNCAENLNVVKCGQNYRALYLKVEVCLYLLQYEIFFL